MTREEALKSTLINDFFEVADFVVFQDPAVHSFISGNTINLESRTRI
jgi:hypothetical protein